jgi:UDP-glucose:glycoprotein glucosyltransferase
MRFQALLLIVLVQSQFIIEGNCRVKKSKSVTTLLEAKWETTPLVLEVVEYLGDESVDFFWSFVNSISSLDPPLVNIENDRERYNVMMDHASKLITPSELSVLKLGLSLHIYSPKVQMFRQIATEKSLPDCPVIVDVGGTFTCDSSNIKNLIENYKEIDANLIDVFNVDTHYPGSENRTKVAVLYGELGTKEFATFHNILKQEAENGNIDYILRHYVQVRSRFFACHQ